MAKEMMIVFVYDMEYCKEEEDDPADAILYFHPNWVSDQQRTSLCGQIMGTTHFLKSMFSCPKILTLQSGKFSIREFERYILAVGTDRNIDDWLLEYRANILISLLTFFHNDIQTVSQEYQNYNKFTEKLYSMFETYLKILQYNGSIFANVPLLQLPKSANNVFLEAIQILQYCQEIKNVLGGTMLYHNKVVATQLSADITKRIVIADPYRIKSPAEIATTNFSLPLGVQLIFVYISNKDYRNLQNAAIRLQNLNAPNVFKGQKKLTKQLSKEPVLSAMKRDQSLIFTTVPEEDIDHQSPTNVREVIKNVRPIADRPKSLSLRSTTSDIKVTNNKPINDKPSSVVCTPFTGKTSVCSTPIAEKVIHGAALSIISTNIPIDEPNLEKSIDTKSESLNSILSRVKSELHFEEFDKILVPISNMIVPNSLINKKWSCSLLQTNKIKNTHKNITLRYYGIGLSKPEDTEEDEEDEQYKKFCNTITDPFFPVFRPDGTVLSKSLYDKLLNSHCEQLATELQEISKTEEPNLENSITEDWKSIDDFDSEMKESPNKTKPIGFNDGCGSSLPKKRSLSLPLKSLTSEQSSDGPPSLTQKRNLSGVQLTPLMSKLSLLAMEEKSSGFCSRDTTPSEFRDFGLTPSDKNYSFLGRKNSLRLENDLLNKEDDLTNSELQKVVLFICGQQDMVLSLLLEQDALDNSELIQKLWDVCTESLGKLEVQLRQCLDPYPVANSDQGETYSYLSLDPQWDTTQRGGPWGVPELGVVNQLHKDFNQAKNITEITLRSEDGIVYGYRCGETEVFYQQSASSTAGLPPPADSMGVVPLKARRKLERDHAIILL